MITDKIGNGIMIVLIDKIRRENDETGRIKQAITRQLTI